MPDPVFDLTLPDSPRSCAVFSSPHSGRDYGLLGETRLSPEVLRSSEDAFVDELFDTAPAAGSPLLSARAPRAFGDLNRAPDDLDPALIAGAARRFLNPRIAAGLGVIPRVVAEGRPIVEGKLSLAEAQRRISFLKTSRISTLTGSTAASSGGATMRARSSSITKTRPPRSISSSPARSVS